MNCKMMPQQYCLRWKHHHSNVQSMFSQLLEKERFCDVTLYCSPSFTAQIARDHDKGGEAEGARGVSLRAHRVVLAACSELLGALLGAHDADGPPGAEPVLVIDGAEPRHVRALLDYMYTGEMNVHHSQLASLLKTAEELRIKGLSDIRWTGKDEPPDCRNGAVTATPSHEIVKEPPKDKILPKKDAPADVSKFNLNGGPPPLIKLTQNKEQVADKVTTSTPNAVKRTNASKCDIDTDSPKRKRTESGTENDEDKDNKDWQHGNMDITAEKVAGVQGWGGVGGGDEASRGSWASSGALVKPETGASDDEWPDPPHDMSTFLQTSLTVDGDADGDDDCDDDDSDEDDDIVTVKHEVTDYRPDLQLKPLSSLMTGTTNSKRSSNVLALAGQTNSYADMDNYQLPPLGPKSGPGDPRFGDVIKLNEYLLHGRRPQFWEEDYVRRVMEAVRLKELEMKQAAEILGVSYGTLYGRYRDVYGCINRPYRIKDFWLEKGPAEILSRLRRGEITLSSAAEALAVSPTNLANYLATLGPTPPVTPKSQAQEVYRRKQELASTKVTQEEFEPIPIEIDPSLKGKTFNPTANKIRKNVAAAEKTVKQLMSSVVDDDVIPVAIVSGQKKSKPNTSESEASTAETESDVERTTKKMCKNVAAAETMVNSLMTSVVDEPVPVAIVKNPKQAGVEPRMYVVSEKSKPNILAKSNSGKWPSIRVASIETLRETSTSSSTSASTSASTSPTALMKNRPDLTIVASNKKRDDEET